MSTEIFRQFYARLVKTLPMDDAVFIAELYSSDLLPADLKEHIESNALPTLPKKASYFLDHMIKPGVTSDEGGRQFYELLRVMDDSDYQGVKELAKQIRDALKVEPTVDTSELYS